MHSSVKFTALLALAVTASTTQPPTPTEAEAALILTTVFTQPTECIGGITEYAGAESTLGYWVDIPFPAPGVTVTSCFPPALVPSVTASVDLPPYKQLVCPHKWESFDFNSTYRICCPKDFGFYLPNISGPRPGFGAWCTSWARPGTHAALTRYLTDGRSTLIDTTLESSEGWMVRATAFDGTIATVTGAATNEPSKPTVVGGAAVSSSKGSPAKPSTVAATDSPAATTGSKSSASTTRSWSGLSVVVVLVTFIANVGAAM